MDVLTWILVGLAAGTLATAVVPDVGFGLVGDVVLGIAGAVVAGLIFRAQMPFAGLFGTVAVAFVGATLTLLGVHLLKNLFHAVGQ